MQTVLVLNGDYSFLNVVPLKKAMQYIIKGKVQVEKYLESTICSATETFQIPLVVRFVKFIRQMYKKKVPWSKKNVLLRDDGVCQYCGQTEGAMTVDHVIPKSRGGRNSFENAVCSCFHCNNKKGDRLPSEANMFLTKKPIHPTIAEFTQKVLKKSNIENIFKTWFSEN